ncbi:beta-ketoacyl-ACP synthase III [Trichlorobacter ammonificans]|uniref:Beta-ketoacyl-[acyl-carrier-protein] synthase III n=1 Tax=Trichlorobacter ammonificans TaxID=2916410 RepID=A0ABN8HGJ6_9BACT|nr:beta-ketoacyl-ACP synthase III [Trichlorobacter ammonificans]CAH2030307.1 3-oxoacyl-[acyl-carrier-protein] synthase 3 [Trichlorobacter ammonificans]
MRHAHIIGSGAGIPERIVGNDFFSYLVDDPDEWISSRTGIRERRFVKPEESTSDLAVRAARAALENAGITAAEIDCIVVGTSTPDMILPATACMVQKEIGAQNAFAFDLNSVCGSFVFALDTADSFIRAGKARTALVIGADTYSKILDFNDKTTCPLFGDGAAAVVLRVTDQPDTGILHSFIRTDGNGWPLIQVPSSGSRKPITAETIAAKENTFYMSGKPVYVFATEAIPELIKTVCDMAGITPADLDWLIPHQANLRILDAVSKKHDIPKEKFLVNLQKYGNTAAASVALALDEFRRNGTIKPGQLVLVMGFGGGLSWGGLLVRF